MTSVTMREPRSCDTATINVNDVRDPLRRKFMRKILNFSLSSFKFEVYHILIILHTDISRLQAQ